MVYKAAKHGVRSGNTLKASNSTYLRRYRTQSFLLRRYINNGQGPDVVPSCVDDVTGTADIRENDVPYSLNKRGRWNLPQIIKDNILNADHADVKFGVQLIERHKINKQANCVGVFSTTGYLKEVSIAKTKSKSKSKRRRRRTGYMHANSILNANPSVGRLRKRKVKRIVEPSVDTETQSSPSLLRYDVVYPSSATSSITHNPKYVGYDTSKPITYSGKRSGHGKQRHRSKMADLIKESISCMDSDFDDSEEENDTNDDGVETVERDAVISLDDIVKHAHRASNLSNSRVRARNASGDNDYPFNRSSGKRQIIYDSDSKPQPDNQDATNEVPNHQTELKPVLVILNREQIDPQVLKQSFETRLFECDCFPRKFIVNISEKVSNMKIFDVYTISASIVFVHDVDNEINNLQEDVYKVFLNTNFDDTRQSVKIETIFDYMETSVDEIVTRTLFFIETLSSNSFAVDSNLLPDYTTEAGVKTSTVEECAKWQTDSYRPNDHYLLQEFLNDKNDTKYASDQGYEAISHFDSFKSNDYVDVASPRGRFCSICCELLGNATTSTALISCCHWFCDDCWNSYLATRVRSGAVTILCPEYDCKKVVDPGTLLSLINMQDIIKLARHCHDVRVDIHDLFRWCPNEKCGRVLNINSAEVKTGQCQCGQKLCFDCLGKPHWPAPCKLITNYHQMLRDDDLLDDENTGAKVTVHGKHCPNCHNFITKEGGCPYMYCICGKGFCWGCGKDYSINDHSKCSTWGFRDKHKTQEKTIKTRDLNDIKLKNRGTDLDKWYHVAVQHRTELSPDTVRKMKSKVKELSKKIQSYMVRSERKGESVSLDFEMQSKSYVREADKTPDFLKNMISLHAEINYLVENTAILLYLESMKKVNRRKLQHIVSRLSIFCTIIFELFMDADNKLPKHLICRFREVRFHSRKTIHGLVRCVKESEQ